MSVPPQLLADLVDELGRRTGLRTPPGRMDALRRVVDRHVASEVAARPGHDRVLLEELVDAAAIDESYFFRHGEQLAFLREVVLPRLVRERGHGHRLQLWSAGCADGEEPYTVAMILAEEGLAGAAEVLATDVSAAAVLRARAATYTPWALRSEEVGPRRHLFQETGARRRLAPAVAEQVTFRQHNLLDAAYPRPTTGSGFDVILCRNVLVHLEPWAVATVIPRLTGALAPGGWLFLAPADPTALGVEGAEDLQPVVLPVGGLVYRRVDPLRDDERRGAARTRAATPSAAAAGGGTDDRGTARRPDRGSASRGTVAARVANAPAGPVADGRDHCREARRLLADARADEALREAQAAAFLEPGLAAVQLTLALAATATGRHAVAGRAFRRAVELLDELPADEPVELCDGETARRLADLARAHAVLAQEASA